MKFLLLTFLTPVMLMKPVIGSPWNKENPTKLTFCDPELNMSDFFYNGNSTFVLCMDSSNIAQLYKDNQFIVGYIQNLQPLYSTLDFFTGYVSTSVLQKVDTKCFDDIAFELIKGLIPLTQLNKSELTAYMKETFIYGSVDIYRGEPSISFDRQGNFTLFGLTPQAAMNTVIKRRGYIASCELTTGNKRFWAYASYLPIITFLSLVGLVPLAVVYSWSLIIPAILSVVCVTH